jgi:two-component system, OmpR family, sensor kinase
VRTLSEAVLKKVSALPNRDWTLVETADAVADLDADKVTQAWLQLASNATRHGTPGTPIELGSRVAADADGGERLQLWVRDHGPGIAPEAHERIFERFRREDEGRGETGSGLGLAIVASIARAHDGSVLLDSIPGIGSTFTLDLPLAAKETTAQ